MGFVFNGYCYPSLDLAAQVESEGPVMSISSGLVAPTGYTVTGASSVNLLFSVYPSSGGSSSIVVPRLYASCETVGPMVNGSGLSLSDVVEVSWGVVATWILAAMIRNMRRGF